MDAKVTGRYPRGFPARLDQKNMTVDTFTSGKGVVIRVDDNENADFWLEITLSKAQLQKMLQEIEEAKEDNDE